jgi:pimeloyl-ACP methyl ester carboxylesterase
MSPPLQGTTIETPAGRVHFHRFGSGETILFLHGCGSLAEEVIAPFQSDIPFEVIAPDRPGYGISDPLAGGEAGMRKQAEWLKGFLDALDVRSCTLVAHSLAAGLALWFAALAPKRLHAMVLVAPFCRPTPEKSMPWLRLATSPVIGPIVRHTLLPPIAGWLGRSRMRALLRPYAIPRWLGSFPYAYAARPSAIVASARELRQFNTSMEPLHQSIPVPVTILYGGADRTADWHWHGPWLRRRAPRLSVTCLPGAGHAPHHLEPDLLVRTIGDRHGTMPTVPCGASNWVS